MAVGLELRTGFEEVKTILRDYVEPEEIANLTPDTVLDNLDIKDVDLLNVLRDMGINAGQYVADFETRRLSTQDVFSRIAAFERIRGNTSQSSHLRDLCQYDFAPDLIYLGQMKVEDLVSIGDYSASCRDCSTK